jgi:hypothetical protein
MNTARIIQLAKQASLKFPSETAMSPVELKFAELIVRDCMEVASPNYMSTPEDSVYYVEQAIDRIAEHFGVES